MNTQRIGRVERRFAPFRDYWLPKALVFLLLAVAHASLAADGEWEWVNPLPQGNALFGVDNTGGNWVAVGGNGTILTSSDAAVWRVHTTANGRSLHDAASDGVTTVAVGDGGTILSSTENATWTERDSGVSVGLNCVTRGPGQFVVGGPGTVLTSTDGINWADWSSGVESSLVDIIWGDGEYVAVGGGTILTSADGVAWESHDLGLPLLNLHGVAWSGDLYIAVGYQSLGIGGIILTSPDGRYWDSPASGLPDTLLAVAWDGSRFVAGGHGGKILTSADGEAWTYEDSGVSDSDSLEGVASDGTNTLFVGLYGAMTLAKDGGPWLPLRSGPTQNLYDIAWLDQQYIAVGGFKLTLYGALVMVSDDGVSWETPGLPVDRVLRGVASDGSQLVAVGEEGVVINSVDGVSWLDNSPGVSVRLNDVVWGDEQFVAVGGDSSLDPGVVLTSADGVSWVSQSVNIMGTLDAVAWNGTRFVVVGSLGNMLTSVDGSNWSLVDSGVAEDLLDVIWDGQRFLAVGHNGTIMVSPDGLVWSSRESETTASLIGIFAGTDELMIVGATGTPFIFPYVYGGSGIVLVSSDQGETWNIDMADATPPFWAATSDGEQFFVAGQSGSILTSMPAATAGADLAVSLQGTPNPVPQQSLLTYQALVTNRGPETASNVLLEIVLPKGVKLQSVSTSEGQCWSARLVITCEWAVLEAENEAIVRVDVNVRRRGSLTATAAVFAEQPDDPDQTNNMATEVTVAEKR